MFQAAAGFLGSALGSLWADDGKMNEAHLPGEPRAKSVIYLFMCGGVSHIDTFDPKDNKWAGKIIDAVGFGDNNAQMSGRSFPVFGRSRAMVNPEFRYRTGSPRWAPSWMRSR